MKYVVDRVDVITMGCSKNLVDSERLMKRLESAGFTLCHDSDNVCGEYAIVNTCGFIGDAKQESIEMILQLAEAKRNGQVRQVYVMGCLSERYREELASEIPEVDGYYGKFDWENIVKVLSENRKRKSGNVKPWDRKISTPSYSTYIKISEGCNRFCAYCAIPLITGRHKSRPQEEILEEVAELVKRGVKEFNVIAQDLSAYGQDIAGKSQLASLIDAMARIPGVEWIRLHYAYPVDFPFDVLDVMNRHDNVCKYLDIALQHISTPVLKNMRRHIDKQQTLDLLRCIRATVPDIKIRTTLMTGFPGETEEDFNELLQFIEDFKFDRLGVFAYSEEDDTWAQKNLTDNIPQNVKDERRDIILEKQEDISLSLNENLIGRTLKVLVERIDEDTIIGRTQWDSPEVDNEVIVNVKPQHPVPSPGDMIEVHIDNAGSYELYGTME